MKRLPALVVLAPLATLSIALHSQANPIQNAPSPSASNQTRPSSHGNILGGGPDGMYLAVIPNAPFTAIVVGEREISDKGKMWSRRLIARDSSGRIFQEYRNFTPDGQTSQSTPALLLYIDSTQRKYYRCLPQIHTCYRYPLNLSTEGTGPPHWGFTKGTTLDTSPGTPVRPQIVGQVEIQGLNTMDYRAKFPIGHSYSAVRWPTTAIPSDIDSEGALNTGGGFRTVPDIVSYQRSGSSSWPTEIGPLHATGKVSITSEFWYSPELQADLKLKYQAPHLTHLFSIRDLHCTEPDPKLFIPPADYKIIDAESP